MQGFETSMSLCPPLYLKQPPPISVRVVPCRAARSGRKGKRVWACLLRAEFPCSSVSLKQLEQQASKRRSSTDQILRFPLPRAGHPKAIRGRAPLSMVAAALDCLRKRGEYTPKRYSKRWWCSCCLYLLLGASRALGAHGLLYC